MHPQSVQGTEKLPGASQQKAGPGKGRLRSLRSRTGGRETTGYQLQRAVRGEQNRDFQKGKVSKWCFQSTFLEKLLQAVSPL